MGNLKYREDMNPEELADFKAQLDAEDQAYAGAAEFDESTRVAHLAKRGPCPSGMADCEGCEACCTEDCEGCANCHEDDSPRAMGWVGHDGRP